jgi:DNA-binding NarL/FixJ family response regulator
VLIAPNDLNWAAVRQLLQSMQQVEIIADLTSQAEAMECDGVRSPEAIVGSPAIAGDPTLELMQNLQSRWDGAKVILLVDRHACDRLEGFAEIPDSSCLCWNDLTPDALQHCLLAALAAPLRMVSASVASSVAATADAAPKDAHAETVSARAAAILRGLGEGLTEQQVAAREGISVRTVQRVIAELQWQFNSPSLFALGRSVEQLGLLSTIAPAPEGDRGRKPPRRLL